MSATTIYAIASPPGASARAVLRISGPAALTAAALVFAPMLAAKRAQIEGRVRVRGRELPALALVMPAPHSYTGEDTVELHLPGSPLLLGAILEELAPHEATLGLLPASPGEFTRRAFAHGKLDLAQAEGVLMLIHSEAEQARRLGMQWLRGGLSQAIAVVRDTLQHAHALLVAGLDFTEGETGEVEDPAWRTPLASASAQLDQILAELPAALPGGEVLLLGAANAGKSSLCNALAGRDEVLVDSTPGTTRDLVRIELAPGVALWDTPGDLSAPGQADRAALALRDQLGQRAACALLVLDPANPNVPRTAIPWLALVWTKSDLGSATPPFVPPAPDLASLPQFSVSARTGVGIAALRTFLLARATAGVGLAAAPLREHLARAAAFVHSARQAPLGELASADLELALQELDAIDGTHSPEDLLDRIFARFCLGK